MIRFHTAETMASLRALEHELDIVARQSLGQAATFALAHARATSKFKDVTGKLRSTLERVDRGPYNVRVRTQAKYALFVEEDTRAHEIRPKRTGTVSSRRSSARRGPRRLVFRIAGRWFSKAVVKHPGTTGTHFMRDARDEAEVRLIRFVEVGVDRATR